MKTAVGIGALALVGLFVMAGLRRSAPETPRPAKPARPAAALPAPAAAAPVGEPFRRTAERLQIRPQEVDAFVAASRELVRELRRIRVQRQSEWSVELDQQARLEWEERYDADRPA